MFSKGYNTEKIEKASLILKSIAHPIRIKILTMLKDGKEHTVTEIYLSLECEQSTISHHLSIMKDKGVLKSRRDGKNTFYGIKKDAFVDCINKAFLQKLNNFTEA